METVGHCKVNSAHLETREWKRNETFSLRGWRAGLDQGHKPQAHRLLLRVVANFGAVRALWELLLEK